MLVAALRNDFSKTILSLICLAAVAGLVFALPKPVHGTVIHGLRIKVKDGLSTNWSGYAVETNLYSPLNNVVTDVKGSWTVPSVTCTSNNTYSSVWVGIDGYSDNTVEQTGTEQDCSSGSPKYSAWYEMYPRYPYRIPFAVSAGDSISGEVKFLGRGYYNLHLQNNTTGAVFNTTQRMAKAQRQSAEWIVEAPSSSSGVLPLADFGTVNLNGAQATINGVTGTISNSAWQNDPITMVNSSGAVKASPSALSGDGSSFSVNWAGN